MSDKALFAAGCFWGIEETFRRIPGVLKTTVGYTGGVSANPTYREVCSGTTHHAEAVLVEYNPADVTYQTLLETFWKCHNPTTANRQGPDIGTQYRSAIFTFDESQTLAAELSKETLEKSKKFPNTIVTEILSATKFHPAEDYHQQYHQKMGGSCQVF